MKLRHACLLLTLVGGIVPVSSGLPLLLYLRQRRLDLHTLAAQAAFRSPTPRPWPNPRPA